MARGRWVAYLGHDDLWFPWHLSSLVETIEREGASFAHALMVYFGETGFTGCWGAPPEGVDYAEMQMPPSCWLHRPGYRSVFVERKVSSRLMIVVEVGTQDSAK